VKAVVDDSLAGLFDLRLRGDVWKLVVIFKKLDFAQDARR
jgi:hypothetical protein